MLKDQEKSSYNWLAQDTQPTWRFWAGLLAALAAYALLFPQVYALLGNGAPASLALAIVALSWYVGVRRGLLVALSAVVLSIVLFNSIGRNGVREFLDEGYVVSVIFFFLLVTIIGSRRNLLRRVHQQALALNKIQVAQQYVNELAAANASLQQEIVERRRLEAELAAERNLLRTVVDNLPAHIYAKDTSSRFVFVNEQLRRDYVKGNLPDPIGLTDFDLIKDQKYAQGLFDNEQALMRGEATFNNVREISYDEYGNRRYILATKLPLHDETGQVIGLVGIGRNVTDQVLAEQELRAREELLRLFIKHIPAPIAMFDREMRYLLYSDSWLKSYPIPHDDITGMSHYDVFSEVPERWRESHRRCLAGAVERADEDLYIRKDGAEDWIQWEIHPWRDSQGEIGGIVMFTEVITERKRAQEAVRLLNEQLEQRVAERTDELKRANEVLMEQIAMRLQTEDALWSSQIELQGQAEALVTVNEIADSLYRALDLPTVIDRAVEAVMNYTRCDTVAIYMLDDEAAVLVRMATQGVRNPEAMQFGATLPLDGSLSGWVVQQSDLIICEDVAHDERLLPLIRRTLIEDNVKAIVFVPLLSQEKALGVLNLFFLEPHTMTAREQETLLSIGKTVGLALSNARYVERIREEVYERWRAEAALRYRVGFETLVAAISANFINLELADIDPAIHDALRRVGEFIEADRAYLFLFAGETFSNTHEWYGPGVLSYRDQLQGLLTADFAWLMDQLARRELVRIPRVADLPPEAAYERQVFEEEDIQALVLLPLYYGSERLGFLGFDSVRSERTWPDDEVLPLKIVGEIIVNTLQRQRAEQQLAASEERYRAVSELMSDYAYAMTVDEQGTVTLEWVTEAFQRITGYSTQEIVAHSDYLALTVYPDDRARVSEHFARALANETHIAEYRTITRDGRVRWLRNHLRPAWSEQAGRVVRLYGGTQDVTERKVIEAQEHEQRMMAEALRDTAALVNRSLNLDQVLGHILDTVQKVVPHDSASMMLLEDDGTIRIARVRGYPPSDIEQMKALTLHRATLPTLQVMSSSRQPLVIDDTELYPLWQKASFNQWIRSFVGAPIDVDGEVYGFINLDSREIGHFSARDGERLMAFANQVALAVKNARLFESVRRYVDELELRVLERTAQIEEQIRRREAVLNSVADAVIVADLEGHVLETNPVVQHLQQQEDGAAARLAGLIAEVAARLADPQVVQYTSVVELGRWTFQAGASKVFYGEQVLGLVIVLRDVTRFEELARLKNQFVDNVSHELRTPLANINLYVSLLRKGRPERRPEYVEVIDRETQRLRRLIDELLNLSRLEDSRHLPRRARSAVDVNDLLTQVVEMHRPQARERQLRLDYTLDARLLPLQADRDQLVQVFTNLVGNAIAYTPPGGCVTVSSQAAGQDDRAGVLVEISDTGIGILPEDLDYIFDRFYRGSNSQHNEIPGTGLGLAITKEIIELHNGKIDVASMVNEGSKFSVYLPYTKDSAAPL